MTSEKNSLKNMGIHTSTEPIFQKIFESHAAIMLLIDPGSGDILDANHAAEEFYGYSKIKLCQMSINEINTLPPEQVTEERRKALEANQNYFVFPHRLASGEERIVEVHSSPVSLQDRPVLFSIIHDITERKHTEEALRESQSLYHSLVEVSPLSICRKDLDGRFTFANRRFLELSETTLGALIGKTDFDLHPPELAEKYRSDDLAVMHSGQTQELIEQRAVLDGQSIFVQTIKTPIHDGSGRINGIQISFWDITDRKQSEDALHESEEKFRTIFEMSSEGIVLINEHGTIIEWNRAQEQLTGIPRAEAIGAPAWEIQFRQVPGEKRSQDLFNDLKQDIFKILKMGQYVSPQTGEIEIESVSGEHRTLLQSTFPIETKRGYRCGIMLHDISERAHLEHMKSDFINRASHELRTPLTTAILMAELLEEGGTAEQQQQFITMLKQQLNRQRLLLNDLLVAGRAESKKLDVHLTSADILPIIEEAISSVKPQADLQQQTIHLSTDKMLPKVNTDPQALLQVFLNLLSNAIKFSNPFNDIEIHVHDLTDSVSIAVTDHGMGIPAKDLPHITSRFFRAENATKMEIPGTGIGLYIIKEIMGSLGGQMQINSIENQGTTITILIPLQPRNTHDPLA